MRPELKVYGHCYPADTLLEQELRTALESAITCALSDDLPLLARQKDMLTISFEGRYFPEEEVIAVLTSHITPAQKGKVDVLDLENWRMRRYLIQDGALTRREASLNSVLDYSGF